MRLYFKYFRLYLRGALVYNHCIKYSYFGGGGICQV